MANNLWFKELGYKENPFIIKPAYFDDEVIGYDKEIDDLIKMINENKFCFLEGEFGKGKTTIINFLINEFIGYNKIIYISRNRSDRALNYEDLLIGSSNFFGRLFRIKPKNVILVVDEVSKINKKDCEQIEKFYEDGHFKAVLFCDVSLDKSNLTQKVKTKISKNVITLKDLTAKEAIELVKSRLENDELISEELIKKVFDKSEKNIRLMFINLDKIFRKAFELGKTSISEEDIKEI
jgi:replication-associated recombination protein RarA